MKRWLADPRLHTLAQCALALASGFAMSAASLANRCQPLALGMLCATSGWMSILTAAGSITGYLVFWGSAGAQGVVWIMAGVLAATILGDRPILRIAPLLMPAIAALITAAVGLAFQVWQNDATPVAVYLLRVAAAFLSATVFTVASGRRDPVIDWILCALGVLALSQIFITPYIGLGYIAAAICCIGTFPGAALAGLALDLAQITPVPMTAVMSLSYLLRLLPVGRKKLYYAAPVAVYFLVMQLCGLWDVTPLAGLAIGGVAAMFIPVNPNLSHRRGETGVAQVRLEMVSAVMRQTEQLLKSVQDAPIDEAALIARAAERACSSCPYRKNCREKPEQMSTAVLHRPLGNGEDLPAGCRKTGRLLQELRRSQEHLRTIRADRDRRQEYRWAVTQQYAFLSEYLQDVSDTLAKRETPAKQWYQPEIAVCSTSRENSNGDRCLWFAGVECRYYILLCDGMGTGEEAAKEGKVAGSMLRKLLSAGYPAEYALRTVNSLCALRGKAGIVTIDLAELRLDTGKVTLYKWGAAPSYLLVHGEPIKIGTATPPPGLSVTNGRETVERLSLRRGETLVLLSDGAGGEDSLRFSWGRTGEPASELAAEILEASRTDGCDDATVAVVRLTSAPVST